MNIAIVPARGGSKRLPGKNVIPLNGKPLIHYTLEAVINSNCFDEVILSSDDENILKIGSQIPNVTAELRESKYASDNVKVIDLIKNIADRKGYDEKYSKIGLFLPTCPFRTARHIEEGMKLLKEEDFSVVSVTEMTDPIQLSLTIDHEHVMNPEALISPSPLVTGETRSQDFEKYFRVNGGFYIAWMSKFREAANFFSGRTKAYYMSPLNSIDIDYPIDLEWAEYLLKNDYIQLH